MENKIFFQPGDIVTLNKNIPNKPIMYVVGKKTAIYKPSKLGDSFASEEEFLKGILCRWFSTTGEMLEGVFNTKDLQNVEISK